MLAENDVQEDVKVKLVFQLQKRNNPLCLVLVLHRQLDPFALRWNKFFVAIKL